LLATTLHSLLVKLLPVLLLLLASFALFFFTISYYIYLKTVDDASRSKLREILCVAAFYDNGVSNLTLRNPPNKIR
jgi:hypothetical protein